MQDDMISQKLANYAAYDTNVIAPYRAANLSTSVLLNLKQDDDEEVVNAEAALTKQGEENAKVKRDEGEEEDIDELLKEVQKELHTRFKNMFEGDMLLPNLDFNPEFEGKTE